MKKNIIETASLVALVILITACAGMGKLNSGGKAGGDELDSTIREASNYLNTRIPNGNKVAFINISGGYPDLADYILSDLSRHGVNDGKFSVVDRALLDQVRAELNFNLSGEVDDNSAQAIGKMLGAQTIVSGSVRKLGELYRLEVKAIEVQTASVQGQQVWNIPNGSTIAALTGNTGTAASSGSGASGQSKATASGGQTTQTAAPASAYKIGDNGPAGGLIFYDKGNNQGGWRYLEAAPADIDRRLPITTEGIGSLNNHELFRRDVGRGKSNTEEMMKIAATKGGGFGWAAQACDVYNFNGYDDWFLPSWDELNYMYGNLHMQGLGDFKNEFYWSSTTHSWSGTSNSYQGQNFENGRRNWEMAGTSRRVRPHTLILSVCR